jgi:hypothetical protein
MQQARPENPPFVDFFQHEWSEKGEGSASLWIKRRLCLKAVLQPDRAIPESESRLQPVYWIERRWSLRWSGDVASVVGVGDPLPMGAAGDKSWWCDLLAFCQILNLGGIATRMSGECWKARFRPALIDATDDGLGSLSNEPT